MTRNYEEILLAEIMRRNYDAKLSVSILSFVKCGNYRDTGVFKNTLGSIGIVKKCVHKILQLFLSYISLIIYRVTLKIRFDLV